MKPHNATSNRSKCGKDTCHGTIGLTHFASQTNLYNGGGALLGTLFRGKSGKNHALDRDVDAVCRSDVAALQQSQVGLITRGYTPTSLQ